MKNTESIDEAVQSGDQALTGGEAAAMVKGSTMDQRRRRLVRGAAALAPLVLTLRSGALAAASCTGVKITQVTPDSATGVIADNSVIPGDVCAPNLHFCPDGKALTDSLGNDYQTVESDLLGNKTCGDAQYKGTTVAILSSQSATSMINAG